MFTKAEKANTVHVSRQQQNAGTSFFRKAGEDSFFRAQEAASFFSPPIQAKLSVSSPDDPQEKEADAVADQVMRMPDPSPSVSGREEEKKVQTKSEIPVIHRSAEASGQEELQAKLAPHIQRSADAFGDSENKANIGEAFMPSLVYRKPISLYRSSILHRSGRAPPKEEPSFDQQLASTRGGGSALPSGTKSFMESRFGADFSGVRIHTGSQAAGMSNSIHAQAFTHGNDIYFNHGKYSPDTASGGALLAHELTHTIQQGASSQTKGTSAPASSTVSRKPIIQRSAEGSVPQLTAAVELAKSKEGKVNANKEGPDGNREGWQDLVDFFKTTFGEDKIVSGSGGTSVQGAVAEADIKKKRTTTGTIVNPQDINGDRISGERDAMPSWCGIFVFWALNKSGVPMPKWKLGESVIKPEAAYPPGHVPKAGDIAYKSGYSHYAIVESADASTVRTVNGNTAGEDNLGAQIQTRDHPMSNWTGFFNPLLNMEGSLGTGEGTAGSVPKSLRELRRELFKVDRKEEGGETESQEQVVEAKPELNHWSVDSKGSLQTKPSGTPENVIQTKEEDKKEDEKQTSAIPNLQRKPIFDIHRECDSAHGEEQETASGGQVQLKSDAANAVANNLGHVGGAIQSTGLIQNRGPPSQGSLVQRSVIDDALNFIGSVTDCISLDLDEAKRCGLQKAQQVALHIPGYRALRVVLGSDPITSEGVERNGRNFIEAAFDIMPGGELLYQKLDETHLLDSAAEWIDTQIQSLESIVDDLFDQFDAFWGRLGVSDFTSPMDVLRDGANIVLGFINNVIDFAVDAAVELLTRIKDYLLEKIVDFIKEETTAYPLLCVILGKDPITEEEVEPNGTNILNALLELGGEEGVKQRTQMQETGTFQKVVDYIDEGISVFSGAYERIVQGFKNIWDRVSIESLMDPVGTFTEIYNEFAQPIQDVWDFVSRVGAEILALIKEVLMQRLSAWARTVRGYSLVTVIIGKDPFTDEEVPFTMENVIKGFFSLMEAGEEQYNQLKESGAIDRTVAKITAAVARLNMTPAAIVQLFIDLWNSFSLDDLMNPIAAFQRIIAKFGEPIGRLIAFVIEIIMIVIEAILIVMNFPFDLINNIIAKAMQAYQMIKRDPVGFLKNLLRAIKQGFIQFFDNILQHLLAGLVGWLTSELRDAGVPAFTDTSLRGIISWVLQILGISMEKIWEKLAAHPRIGPQRVARIRSMINTLEGIWTFIKDVQERGMAAIWDKIQEQLSNLWNTILDAVKNWIMEQIVNRIVARLLSMLDPTGIMAVVNSVIALYNAIQSVIKYMREMLEIVNSFVEGVVDIASGNIDTAANYLERTLARAVPIVIGFLANQVGLNGIGHRIGEMIGRAQEMVDEALTWLVNRAVDTGMALFDRVMAMGASARDAVLGWLGLRKTFNDTGGGDHSIYFQGSGASAQLYVASYNPRTVRTLLTAAATAINRPENSAHVQSYQDAVSLNEEIETIKGRLANPNNATANQDNETLNQKMTLLATKLPPLMTMVGGSEPPPLVKPSFSNGVKASSFEVAYLKTGRLSGGSSAGSNSGRTLLGWPEINGPGLSAGAAWVKMHLLTEQLGGPALDSNLTPATQQVNTAAYNQVERQAIQAVSSSKTIWYKVDIGYHAANDKYANSIVIEFGPYQFNSGSNQWERKASGTVVDGDAVGGPPFSASPELPVIGTTMPNLNDPLVGRVRIENLAPGLTRQFAEFVQSARGSGFADPNDIESKLVASHNQRTVKIENFMAMVSALKSRANQTYTLT